MRNEDIFVQILSEVTGQPEEDFWAVIKPIKKKFPKGHKLEKELTDEIEGWTFGWKMIFYTGKIEVIKTWKALI